MKLITIHETENTLEAIDDLVRQRVFNSRAEAYRAGALLMITVNSARRLALADRLDSELYSKEVRRSLTRIRKGDLDGAREGVKNLEEALRLKAILSRVNGKDEQSIETIAEGFHRYSEALAEAKKMDPGTRQRMVKDLSRDLQAVKKLSGKS